MALTDYKITNADFNAKDIASLSDRPSADGMSATALKERFDAGTKKAVVPKVNAMIDYLVGENGAADIGAKKISGVSGYKVQDILESIKAILDTKKPTETADKEIAQKFDTKEAQALVKTIEFNESNGVFTITKYDGTVQQIDTAIEKVALNVRLEDQQFVLTLLDGTEQRVDLSAFITETEVKSTNTIALTIEDGVVSAKIIDGSVKLEHLADEVTTYIDGKEQSAKASADTAAVFMTDAKLYATDAETSYQNAKECQTQACQCATNASESEEKAKQSENNAAENERNAKTAETNAQLSATNAEASYQAAKECQVNACQCASNALESEQNAAKSENNAKESETNAQTFAENAENSAEKAIQAANDAATIVMNEAFIIDDDNGKFYQIKKDSNGVYLQEIIEKQAQSV